MPNTWDPLPAPTIGDHLDTDTYAAVGRALSQWESFELDLAEIFSLLVSGGYGNGTLEASRSYGSITSFRGRCDLVEAAAEAYFELRAEQTETYQRISQFLKLAAHLSARRNEVAHGIVLPYVIFGEDGGPKDGGFCLFAPMYNARKSGVFGFPKYIMSSKEIEHWQRKFAEMDAPSSELYQRIHIERQPLPRKHRALHHQRL